MDPRALIYFRVVLALACFGWGFYFSALLRTSGFGSGESVGLFFSALVYVAPLAVIPFIGLPKKWVVLGVSVIWVGTFFLAEVYGSVQESLSVQKYGEYPAEEVTIERWWPFEHHAIFGSEDGWRGWD